MSHIPTLFQRPDRIAEPLYVVTTIFNSARYRTRWKLYEDFIRHCEGHGAKVYTVEVAFGERELALAGTANTEHLSLRTQSELWLKENALNLGVQRLPSDWKYVAWIDADISFVRPDWVDETIHRLQHYPVVQMWSEANDMDDNHEVFASWRSLMGIYLEGLPTVPPDGITTYYGDEYIPQAPRLHPYPHAGYAWAARRDAWDALGGLFDKAILGAADWHMGHALLGHVEQTINANYHPRYKALLREWAARADRSIRQNVGVVPGLVLHHWHGPKVDRRYASRNQILIKNQYDPDLDIKRDWQGLYQLTGRSIALRDSIRRYFHERNEDASS